MSPVFRPVIAGLALLAVLSIQTPVLAADDAGVALFKAHCVNCHGPNADGKTAFGKRFPIPDFRGSAVQSKSDEQLYDGIAHGTGHANYPHSFESRGMSHQNIQALVAYIRSLKK